MKKYISKFHYITQDMPGRSHVEQVQIACAVGANWIQYHCMSKPEDELIDEINEIAEICDDWGATLIITNHYDILHRVDAQGVHMEDPDADLLTIRKVIGEDKTLGVSVSNIDDLQKLQNLHVVDYFTYGPFAQDINEAGELKPIGFAGYRELEKLNIDVPVLATGGIQLADVENLLPSGIYGIAVSSAINYAIDPARALKDFYNKLH
jgi:thiamine-phosphate pyrophosphorylase